jgi:PAS domain S-box-containing protein
MTELKMQSGGPGRSTIGPIPNPISMPYSIKRKILATQLGLLLLLLLIMGGLSLFYMQKSLAHEQLSHLSASSTRLGHHMETVISHYAFLLSRVANDQAVEKFSEEYNESILERYFNLFSNDFFELSFVNEQGQEEVRMTDGHSNPDHDYLGSSPFFQETLWHPNQVTLSFCAPEEYANNACWLTLAYNRQEYGKFVGIIVGKIHYSKIIEELEGFRHGDSGFILLTDAHEHILMKKDEQLVLHPIYSMGSISDSLKNAIIERKNGIFRSSVFGSDSFVATYPVESRDWMLLTVLPYDEFMAASRTLRNMLLFIAVSVLIIGGFAAIGISAGISIPIRKLTESAKKLAKEQWPQAIDLQSNDEVGLLTDAFNTMAANLQKTMTSRDCEILERKKVEQELRRRQTQLAATLKCLGEGLLTTDLKGRITMANQEARQLTGCQEPLGLPFDSVLCLFGENETEPLPDLFDRLTACTEKNAHSFEAILQAGDGRKIPVSLTAARLISDDGQQFGSVIVFRDMSEIYEANKELQYAKEAAEKINRLRGEFLANVSHEVRTPLNGIIGITELLLGRELPEEDKRFVRMVQQSSARLLGLINQILDFSRIESGNLIIEHIPFRLRALLEEHMEVFRLEADRKALSLQWQVDDMVPDRLLGDPGRIVQVLLNLISNALKFTEHGSIGIKVTMGDSSQGKLGLHFRVSDTGIGIPPEKHGDIFQAFVQADGSTTRKHGGSGLGLAIASQLAQSMGGQVSVASRPGKGSIFSFTVRCEEDTESKAVAEQEDKSLIPVVDISPLPEALLKKISGLRVLLAEDDFINRTVAETILIQAGLSVSLAETGEEVLQKLEDAEFDFVLMDIQMPEMDGYTACRLIRKREKEGGRRHKILAMTAHFMQEDKDLAQAAGMDGFLTKPINEKILLQTIADHC